MDHFHLQQKKKSYILVSAKIKKKKKETKTSWTILLYCSENYKSEKRNLRVGGIDAVPKKQVA